VPVWTALSKHGNDVVAATVVPAVVSHDCVVSPTVMAPVSWLRDSERSEHPEHQDAGRHGPRDTGKAPLAGVNPYKHAPLPAGWIVD
jgi:hypothetical protein